jgi:cobalt/nickel transport system permease protein
MSSQSLIERTVASLLDTVEHAQVAERVSAGRSWLQGLDPRAKVASTLAVILAATLSRRLTPLVVLLAMGLTTALASSIPLRRLAFRVWVPTLLFTGAIVLPALFLTPGEVAYRLPELGWAVTVPGSHTAALLVARVLTAATFATLLLLSTPWNHFLKALRTLRVPTVFVVILSMTNRYLLVMLETASAMFESRRSRLVARLSGREWRRLTTATAGVLLEKSLVMSNEVHQAMLARGFRGEAYTIDEFRMRPADWVWALAIPVLAFAAVWLRR